MNRFLITLGILGYGALLSTAEPDFSPASVQEKTQQLQATDRAQRMAAVEFLTTWAEKEPAQAKKLFLDLLRNSKEPELRERSLQFLKPIAAREFGEFGEGYLGIQMGLEVLVKIPDEEKPCYGLPISVVTTGSPAEKAALKIGDVIVAVEKTRWHQPASISDVNKGLSAVIRTSGAGKPARFGVWRDHSLVWIDITLTRRPSNLEMMQMQLAPNGAFKIDEAELKRMVEEEKQSNAYFDEWLKRALLPKPDKK